MEDHSNPEQNGMEAIKKNPLKAVQKKNVAESELDCEAIMVRSDAKLLRQNVLRSCEDDRAAKQL